MPVSKAQQKAVSKYMKENYDEIKIRIPNALIWRLLQDAMGVDKTAEGNDVL